MTPLPDFGSLPPLFVPAEPQHGDVDDCYDSDELEAMERVRALWCEVNGSIAPDAQLREEVLAAIPARAG